MTANKLKIIAIVTMTIDHAGAALFPEYFFLRLIGRIAFPIFAYLIYQGCMHTRSKPKYLLRLFIFAVASEIPFNLYKSGSFFDFSAQNVFITLFIGALCIMLIERFDENYKMPLGMALLFTFGIAAELLRSDYGFIGILLIVSFYLASSYEGKVMRIFIPMQIFGLFLLLFYSVSLALYLCSLLPIFFLWLYDGEKGKNINKYFFYVYYPLHLLVVYFISTL